MLRVRPDQEKNNFNPWPDLAKWKNLLQRNAHQVILLGGPGTIITMGATASVKLEQSSTQAS